MVDDVIYSHYSEVDKEFKFKHINVIRNEVVKDEQKCQVLQLIDRSAKVLFDRERDEKMLLSMVNATVQFEI